MKRIVAVSLFAITTLAFAADLKLGTYASTTTDSEGQATLTISSISGSSVSAVYYWPFKGKKTSHVCGGQHSLVGQMSSTKLELADPVGQAIQGCEITFTLELTSGGLKGTRNGHSAEYLLERQNHLKSAMRKAV